jgi:alkyldihydroxyacetonephosphate synthase
MPERERRWNGWGFTDERVPVPDEAHAWVEARLGAGEPLPAVREDEVSIPPPRPLPSFAATTLTDAAVRLRHACGMSFPDIVALRSGAVEAYPDAVCFPADAAEVVAVLAVAARSGLAVIPWGGGTSVVGGVTVPADGPPTVVLALDRLRGLAALDTASLLATFRAGTLGPEVESALAPRGLRLGHEPQSFELSTVGGWVATRSAGHRSTGLGKVDDLVAGFELATPTGLWRLPAVPASAAGPEVRRLVIGSEGRLGVITDVTLRVRPQPEHREGVAVLLPGWAAGVELCRTLQQQGPRPEVVRLSDVDETAFGFALVELTRLAAGVRDVLLRLRRFRHACVLLLEWAGGAQDVTLARQAAARAWRDAGGLALGRSGWRRWLAERFRQPYLRDSLLTAGWGVDTLETATAWSGLAALHVAVREAIRAAGSSGDFPVVTLCHLSHAYADGASLYFTFLWPLAKGRELAQWRSLKSAATEALLAHGGTLTHHHGVGTMHAAYLERENGREGVAALRALAAAFDPGGVLNPGVLLPAPVRGESPPAGGGGAA